ncbi:MAG: hypothetical protein MAG715_00436 [Methanonatronarchaeales archaeon]|nr:hypothetical protein [Methanonatronarchaeales archaeon]
MSRLFVLREEPGAEDLEVLSHAAEGDSVLLLQDAVYAAEDLESEIPLYACTRDLDTRDLETAAEEADYDDIADLLEGHDLVVSL